MQGTPNNTTKAGGKRLHEEAFPEQAVGGQKLEDCSIEEIL